MGDEQPTTPQSHRHTVAPFLLTAIMTGMVGWALYEGFTATIPTENQRVVDILLGNIMGAWFTAISYWFGTTIGSARKTDLLAKAEPIKE